MQVTQHLIDAARNAGWKYRAMGLYEKRPAYEIFTHPNAPGLSVFFRHWPRDGVEYLTHVAARSLLTSK